MNLNKKQLGLILVLLCGLGACAKKADEKKLNAVETPFLRNDEEILFTASKNFKQAVRANDVAKARIVLAQNPQIKLNSILEDGETYLSFAIKNDFLEMRNLLIESGASLEKVNVQNETPLMVAVKNKHEASTRVLIEKKVNLDTKDVDGNTALNLAIQSGQQDIALILIRAGANISISNNQDKNALTLAQETKSQKVLLVLQSILQVEFNSPQISTFSSAITTGDVTSLNNLLSKYPNLARDFESINPLILAIKNGTEAVALEMVNLLLATHINPDGIKKDDSTPLIEAIKLKYVSIAEELLESNAHVNLVDSNGLSPMIHAINVNSLELVKLLNDHQSNYSYTYRNNGRNYTFDVCAVAHKMKKSLSDDEDKEINKQILKTLSCGRR